MIKYYRERKGNQESPSSTDRSNQNRHQFSPFKLIFFLTFDPDTIEIYPLRKSNKFFIDQMNPKTMRCNFHPSMIQLGFQNIWEKPQVLGVEVKEWLEVLAHLLMNDPLGDAIVQDKLVSTLYGLSSLQLRYHTNPDILPHIDAVWDLVHKRIQDGRKFTLPMSMDLPWYKGS